MIGISAAQCSVVTAAKCEYAIGVLPVPAIHLLLTQGIRQTSRDEFCDSDHTLLAALAWLTPPLREKPGMLW